MNLKYYLESLNESEEVPAVLGKRKEWMNIRKVNREKMTNDKTTYQDDKRYHDYMGRQWLNTSASDMMTIVIAALDGCADRNRAALKHHEYMNLTKLGDVIKLLDAKPAIREIIFGKNSYKKMQDFANSDIAPEKLEFQRKHEQGIWGFLSYYMNQKEITVYRGLNIKTSDLRDIQSKDPLASINPQKLIKYFSNETKEFNSFTVNPEISKSFAKSYGGNSTKYVLLKGTANKHDINWAFTAYLMGRHGGVEEQELNINNIRTLKNLQVVEKFSNVTGPITDKLEFDKKTIDTFIEEYNSGKISAKFKGHISKKNNVVSLVNMTSNDDPFTEEKYVYFPLVNNKILGNTAYKRINCVNFTLICNIDTGWSDLINVKTGKTINHCKITSDTEDIAVVFTPATETDKSKYTLISLIRTEPIEFDYGILWNINWLDGTDEVQLFDVVYNTSTDDDFMHALMLSYIDHEEIICSAANEIRTIFPGKIYVNTAAKKFLYDINTKKTAQLPDDIKHSLRPIKSLVSIFSYTNKLDIPKYCRFNNDKNVFTPIESLNDAKLVPSSFKAVPQYVLPHMYDNKPDRPKMILMGCNLERKINFVLVNNDETEIKVIGVEYGYTTSLYPCVMGMTSKYIVFKIANNINWVYDKIHNKFLDATYLAAAQRDENTILVAPESGVLEELK